MQPPFDRHEFGSHCYSSVTVLFISTKTHTNHFHFTSWRNLLTEAAPPRLRALSGYQNSLHYTAAPDLSCVY